MTTNSCTVNINTEGEFVKVSEAQTSLLRMVISTLCKCKMLAN